MAGDDPARVRIEGLERGFFIHVADIEDESQLGHAVKQGETLAGERPGFSRAATEAGPMPGRANDPHPG